VQDTGGPWEGDLTFPHSDEVLAGWLRASTDSLLAALAGTADGSPCWTWWGTPATAGAVARHQAQEAAVHRWDAESARGAPAPLDREVATDGVAEFLEVMLGPAESSVPGTVTLSATDSGGQWEVGRAGDARASVAGTASDLVLLLYRRLPVTAVEVEVEGDAGLVTTLLAAANTQ
jgi:uncharacterized protein (TIGR03083 family)